MRCTGLLLILLGASLLFKSKPEVKIDWVSFYVKMREHELTEAYKDHPEFHNEMLQRKEELQHLLRNYMRHTKNQTGG